jgi:hypothetical protein
MAVESEDRYAGPHFVSSAICSLLHDANKSFVLHRLLGSHSMACADPVPFAGNAVEPAYADSPMPRLQREFRGRRLPGPPAATHRQPRASQTSCRPAQTRHR